jgi:aminopeptidase N
MERQPRRFSGTVTITGTSTTDLIWLHAHKLHITTATIDGREATFTHGENDSLSLSAEGLRAGEHTVAIAFEGTITETMHGLYPCSFTLDSQPEELLATQFESHHAREVFPCVDEPEAKATFDLTLVSETGVTVVSNTPVAEQHEDQGQLVTSFEPTPRMSTYLLAWVVGKLDMQEATTKDGVVVRTYATQGKGSQLSYALEAATALLTRMNDYYGVPYPLPICNLVALPDFSAGAMENWGCITFRENLMLVDEHTAARSRQMVTMVIAHELAHQWFGNLVTMRWWNDLWLNESFANWMEYFITSQLHPDWQLMTQYYDETALAIERDSLATVQKIQQDVHTPDEIQALFDPAIVYAKGGSLINMLHDYLGDDAFRKGLQHYFQRHTYGNTDASDLWQAWSDASGHDVGAFMLPWITQAGLPVVTVDVRGETVNLHQQRFFSNPREAADEHQTWPVPLLADAQPQNQLFDQPSASLTLTPTDKPLLLNQGRTGYYLTKYDTQSIERLAAEVRDGKLGVIDRMGLLSDNLHFAQAGLQPFTIALHLLDSYSHEDSMPVWSVISSYISALQIFAGDDEQLIDDTRRFVAVLAQAQFQRLGWDHVENEPYFDQLLRPAIIGCMAYARDDATIKKLRSIVDAATSPADIPSDIRAIACATTAYDGDEAMFVKLLDWYTTTTSAEHRAQLATGLCSFRNPQLIKRGIDLLMTDTVRLQDMVYWLRGFSRNRLARDLIWRWMQDNWQWIVDQFGNDMHYTDFPKYIASAFSRPEQLTSYKSFFEPLLDQPGIERIIRQGIEDIESRVQWLERDGQAVDEFLRRAT